MSSNSAATERWVCHLDKSTVDTSRARVVDASLASSRLSRQAARASREAAALQEELSQLSSERASLTRALRETSSRLRAEADHARAADEEVLSLSSALSSALLQVRTLETRLSSSTTASDADRERARALEGEHERAEARVSALLVARGRAREDTERRADEASALAARVAEGRRKETEWALREAEMRAKEAQWDDARGGWDAVAQEGALRERARADAAEAQLREEREAREAREERRTGREAVPAVDDARPTTVYGDTARAAEAERRRALALCEDEVLALRARVADAEAQAQRLELEGKAQRSALEQARAAKDEAVARAHAAEREAERQAHRAGELRGDAGAARRALEDNATQAAEGERERNTLKRRLADADAALAALAPAEGVGASPVTAQQYELRVRQAQEALARAQAAHASQEAAWAKESARAEALLQREADELRDTLRTLTREKSALESTLAQEKAKNLKNVSENKSSEVTAAVGLSHRAAWEMEKKARADVERARRVAEGEKKEAEAAEEEERARREAAEARERAEKNKREEEERRRAEAERALERLRKDAAVWEERAAKEEKRANEALGLVAALKAREALSSRSLNANAPSKVKGDGEDDDEEGEGEEAKRKRKRGKVEELLKVARDQLRAKEDEAAALDSSLRAAQRREAAAKAALEAAEGARSAADARATEADERYRTAAAQLDAERLRASLAVDDARDAAERASRAELRLARRARHTGHSNDDDDVELVFLSPLSEGGPDEENKEDNEGSEKNDSETVPRSGVSNSALVSGAVARSIAELRTALSDAQSAKTRADGALRQGQADVLSLRAQLSDAQTSLAALTASRRALALDLDARDRELLDARTRLALAQREVATLRASCQKVQGELRERDEAEAPLKKARESLKFEMERLVEAEARARGEAARLDERLREAEAEAVISRSMREENERLQEKLTRVRQEGEKAQEEANRMRQKAEKRQKQRDEAIRAAVLRAAPTFNPSSPASSSNTSQNVVYDGDTESAVRVVREQARKEHAELARQAEDSRARAADAELRLRAAAFDLEAERRRARDSAALHADALTRELAKRTDAEKAFRECSQKAEGLAAEAETLRAAVRRAEGKAKEAARGREEAEERAERMIATGVGEVDVRAKLNEAMEKVRMAQKERDLKEKEWKEGKEEVERVKEKGRRRKRALQVAEEELARERLAGRKLAGELDSVRNSALAARVRAHELDERKDASPSDVPASGASTSTMSGSQALLQIDLDAARRKCSDLESRLAKAQRDNERHTKRIAELESSAPSSASVSASSRSAMGADYDRIQKLKQELLDVRVERDQFEIRLNKARAQIESDSKASKEAQIAACKQAVADYQAELDRAAAAEAARIAALPPPLVKADKPKLIHISSDGSSSRLLVYHALFSLRSLNKSDCFIVDNNVLLLVWHGSLSNRHKRAKAISVAGRMNRQRGDAAELIVTEEGSEPAVMWEVFGGRAVGGIAVKAGDSGYYDDGDNKDSKADSKRVVELWRVNPSGELMRMEGVKRERLDARFCFILDCRTEMYVWCGRDAQAEMVDKAVKRGKIEFKKGKRPSWSLLRKVQDGKEPILFREKFEEWTVKEGDEDDGAEREERKEEKKEEKKVTEIAEEGDVEVAYEHEVPYADIVSGNYPPSLDTSRKESYLTEAEFVEVLGMSKEAFATLPGWKKEQLKKAKDLF